LHIFSSKNCCTLVFMLPLVLFVLKKLYTLSCKDNALLYLFSIRSKPCSRLIGKVFEYLMKRSSSLS
jgi:hypothetical protein